MRFIHESIGTDALVEEYIEGRELYVGILGDKRLEVLPIWELSFDGMPEESRPIATERLKWSLTYRKKHAIVSGPARELPENVAARIRELCKRVYRNLMLSGYARIDLRLRETGEPCIMEANPNPQLSADEDFADSAKAAGVEYTALVQRIVELGLRFEPSRLGSIRRDTSPRISLRRDPHRGVESRQSSRSGGCHVAEAMAARSRRLWGCRVGVRPGPPHESSDAEARGSRMGLRPPVPGGLEASRPFANALR